MNSYLNIVKTKDLLMLKYLSRIIPKKLSCLIAFLSITASCAQSDRLSFAQINGVQANAVQAKPITMQDRISAQQLLKDSPFVQASAIGLIKVLDNNQCMIPMIVKKTYSYSSVKSLKDNDKFTLKLPCSENPQEILETLSDNDWIDTNQQLRIDDLKKANVLELHLLKVNNKDNLYVPLAMPTIVRKPTNMPVSNPLVPGAEWERFVPHIP